MDNEYNKSFGGGTDGFGSDDINANEVNADTLNVNHVNNQDEGSQGSQGEVNDFDGNFDGDFDSEQDNEDTPEPRTRKRTSAKKESSENEGTSAKPEVKAQKKSAKKTEESEPKAEKKSESKGSKDSVDGHDSGLIRESADREAVNLTDANNIKLAKKQDLMTSNARKDFEEASQVQEDPTEAELKKQIKDTQKELEELLKGHHGITGFDAVDDHVVVYIEYYDVLKNLPVEYKGVEVEYIVTGKITKEPVK